MNPTEAPERIEVPDGMDVCNNCGELFRVLIWDGSIEGTTDRPQYDPMDPRCGCCR